ncbi:hypothetical protein [Rhizomonospora bruguierae]|uniref:hypothetical protein n=1 Tax=Rhizomonospora bruguierae TaxID=1581705 RepID=UPI001BCB8935|nr:hypothetical protein [Micromonospora sp. NBRC 107566]
MSGGLASIDDLLEDPEEGEQRPGRAGSAAGWIAKSAFAAAIGALIVLLVLRAGGVTLPFALLFAAAYALLVLRRVLREVQPAPVPRARRRATRDESEYMFGTGDALRSALSRWENRLAWVRDDAPRFTSKVRDQIAETVDERLRQRHGISRAADPVRARQMLGERLWRFLTEPVVRPQSSRALAELIGDVERI